MFPALVLFHFKLITFPTGLLTGKTADQHHQDVPEFSYM
jgi:hypothetical protein